MRPFILLAILAIILPLGGALPRFPGGWRPIKDIDDPHVRGVAEFAVHEFYKKSHRPLKFVCVIKGETQIVNGINYRLVIKVAGAEFDEYEASVKERIPHHHLELISFNATNN